MNAVVETWKVARSQALIALGNCYFTILVTIEFHARVFIGSTIPGYWFTVFFVDSMGHKTVQIMGFIMMTIFMAAAAGSYNKLLDPNTLSNEHLSHEQQQEEMVGLLCTHYVSFLPTLVSFI